ncbi:primase-helicase family protein [Phaeovulum sp.]|uniref:primase-helicase family protein n=1 Tax=Phaeovulum sp. TaxID=2934796 RepID=UPI0039E59C8E
MNVTNINPHLVATKGYDPEHLTTLSRAMASWFVRLNNNYHDVDDLAHRRSRVDVEQTAMIRFREEFPDIPLTNDLVAAVLKRVIHTRHTVVEETILPWSGNWVFRPGNHRRIIVERGVATINTWREPSYRRLAVTEAEAGVAGEFLDWFFTRKPERDMFVNWLAWSLQHEEDKPNWAPFFYSSKMGTGKSALGRLLIRLFGEANSITQNNVDKLTGRFNMTLLQSKLVVCEEVNLKLGGGDANTLKTYITEKFTAGEAKGRETERVEQRVCMVLTSNHMPFWIEAEDRRYYIVNIDHDGYARGPRAEEFAELVGRLEDWAEEPANIARLYNALMIRVLPDDFSAKTLNVEVHGTEIMKQVFGNGRATVLDQLQEHLDVMKQHAVPEAEVVEIVTGTLKANINTTKHLMSDLGWVKRQVKWGGTDYARQIWVRQGYTVERGRIFGPDGFDEALATHLKETVYDV